METPNRANRPIIKTTRDREDLKISTIVLYTLRQKPKKGKVRYDFLDELSSFVLKPGGNNNGRTLTNHARSTIAMDLGPNASNYYGVFNNFFIASISESRNAISKIHMNFANSWNAFFFQESPVQISVSGGFLDSEEFPYYQEFMTAYEKYMAPGKLAKAGLGMIFSYDGRIVDGFITNINVSMNVDNMSFKAFSFTLVAKSMEWERFNDIRSDGENGNLTRSTKVNSLSNKERLKTLLPKDSVVTYVSEEDTLPSLKETRHDRYIENRDARRERMNERRVKHGREEKDYSTVKEKRTRKYTTDKGLDSIGDKYAAEARKRERRALEKSQKAADKADKKAAKEREKNKKEGS